MLEGGAQVALTCVPLFQGKSVGMFSYLAIVLGAVTALFGVGLLARVELVRGIMNVFCGLQILFGLIGLVQSILVGTVFGPLGLVMMFFDVLQIATAAFMIYLIGETDRAAPNL